MDVVYFGSREIYPDFVTAINSLRANNKANVYAIIEDESLGIPDVTYIKWDYRKWFNNLNTQTKWKDFGVLRAALSKVFPDKDKILSLDVDTIVTGDISDLWNVDLGSYHMAMVREPYLSGERTYFNAGVALINLKLLREDGTDDKMIRDLNSYYRRYVAQDTITEYCRVLELPSTYNSCKFTAPCGNAKIIHYADRTDWRELPEVTRYKL